MRHRSLAQGQPAIIGWHRVMSVYGKAVGLEAAQCAHQQCHVLPHATAQRNRIQSGFLAAESGRLVQPVSPHCCENGPQ